MMLINFIVIELVCMCCFCSPHACSCEPWMYFIFHVFSHKDFGTLCGLEGSTFKWSSTGADLDSKFTNWREGEPNNHIHNEWWTKLRKCVIMSLENGLWPLVWCTLHLGCCYYVQKIVSEAEYWVGFAKNVYFVKPDKKGELNKLN